MDQDLFLQDLDLEFADRHVAPPEQKRPPFSGGLLIALIEVRSGHSTRRSVIWRYPNRQ